MNLQPEQLEDELCKLIPLKATDYLALYEVASDPLIWEQHPENNRYEEEVFKLFFEEAIQSKSAFLIFEKSSGKLIGSTRYYDYSSENSSVAIGYTFLSRAYWGGKYNKSIKKLLIDYAFQQVDKVIFHIGAENIRSQLATGKIGAKKISEFTRESNGILHSSFEYEILKTDWYI